ncbi:MAG TPA: hypothetical protein VL614_30785 [Acetobacteraceae bacterium]|nr:hypothetical protein [Acetobacteraceae bacterium]
MSAIGPLPASTADTLPFPSQETQGPMPPAAAAGSDGHDTVTLSPAARMLLAVSEMLAQAEGGADTAIRGQVLDVLNNIKELAQAPAQDGGAEVRVASNSGSGGLIPGGDGSGADAATPAQIQPLGQVAYASQVAATLDDTSASQSLQGNGMVLVAVPGDGTGANASVTLDSVQPDQATGSADTWITAGVSRASAQAVGSSGNDWIAAYAMVPGQRDITDASVAVSGGGGDDRIRTLSTGMLSVDAGAGDDVVDAHFASYGVVSGGDGNDLIYMAGSLATADGGAGNDIIMLAGQSVGATGGEGNDTISGADWAAGGTGNDTLELSNAKVSGATFARGDGTDTIMLSPIEDGRSDVSIYSTSVSLGGGTIESHDIWLAYGTANEIKMDLPQPGEAGYGLAHTVLTLGNIGLHDVQSTLDGTDLTLAVAGTGDSITIRNYLQGRVTFVFDNSAQGNGMIATRQLPIQVAQ